MQIQFSDSYLRLRVRFRCIFRSQIHGHADSDLISQIQISDLGSQIQIQIQIQIHIRIQSHKDSDQIQIQIQNSADSKPCRFISYSNSDPHSNSDPFVARSWTGLLLIFGARIFCSDLLLRFIVQICCSYSLFRFVAHTHIVHVLC